ncbi:MAG: hypothetical protein D6769_03590, partial [Methanobacteriota archaeon]
MEVLLDTNFIVYALTKRISLDSINELFEERVAILTVPGVKAELMRMAAKNSKEGIMAKVALDLNIPIVESRGSYADTQLLNYIYENERSIVATNDYKLIQKLKKAGKRVVTIKKDRISL